MRETIRLLVPTLLAVFVIGCPSDGRPKFDRLAAEPDSLPRGGTARLVCLAYDPDGGEVEVSWNATVGMLQRDEGDTVLYLAPDFDVVDTVRVLIEDDQREEAESLLVLTIAEGLCGGRPEYLVNATADLARADSFTVYYVETATNPSEVRWVRWDGSDHGTIGTWTNEVRDIDYRWNRPEPQAWFFLERDDSGAEPRDRVTRLSLTTRLLPDSVTLESTWNRAVVADFGRRDSAILAIAAGSRRVYAAWHETTDTLVLAHVTSFPLAGGGVEDWVVVTSNPDSAAAIGRIAADGGDVFCLVFSNDETRNAVLKLETGTGAVTRLADAGGGVGPADRLALAGSEVFWTEGNPGRIGAVGRDGTDSRYVVPAGGAAEGVSDLIAADGLNGPRLLWAVPGDLRGMILATGSTIYDLDRGGQTIGALCRNDYFAFYVRDDGNASVLWRLLIP